MSQNISDYHPWIGVWKQVRQHIQKFVLWLCEMHLYASNAIVATVSFSLGTDILISPPEFHNSICYYLQIVLSFVTNIYCRYDFAHVVYTSFCYLIARRSFISRVQGNGWCLNLGISSILLQATSQTWCVSSYKAVERSMIFKLKTAEN